MLTRDDVQHLLHDRNLLGSLAIQHKNRNHKQSAIKGAVGHDAGHGQERRVNPDGRR